MAKIEVLRAADHEPVDGYRAPTCTLDGTATSRFVQSGDSSLWLVTATLEPGARLAWNTNHGDETIYVLSGRLTVDGRSCETGGVIVVESGVPAALTADRPSTVLHFGPHDPHPPTDGRFGPPRADAHRVHVVGPGGVDSRSEHLHETRWFADASCPTCRASLMFSSRGERYESALHSHSQDELIYVLDGELKLGNLRVGPGDALSVAAFVRYRFECGEDGYRFLNYSADSSAYIPADENAPKLGRGRRVGDGYKYSGDGTDYLTEAEYLSLQG
jgi:quercetin dioxygenase-like cupin family protein